MTRGSRGSCPVIPMGDASLEDTVRVAEQVGAHEILALALGERSLLAMARGDWGQAEALAGQVDTAQRRLGMETVSLPEIGAELFLSPHTVKSQAISIYRKLGTCSRSQAVTDPGSWASWMADTRAHPWPSRLTGQKAGLH